MIASNRVDASLMVQNYPKRDVGSQIERIKLKDIYHNEILHVHR